SVPVIFITAQDEPSQRRQAIAVTPHYLAKPFLGEILVDAVHCALEQERSRSQRTDPRNGENRALVPLPQIARPIVSRSGRRRTAISDGSAPVLRWSAR